MRALETLRSAGQERPVAEVLEMMGREDVSQMPVVQHANLAGIISRGQIVRVLQTRAELDSTIAILKIFFHPTLLRFLLEARE